MRDKILFSIGTRRFTLVLYIAIILTLRFFLGLPIPLWAAGVLLFWLLSTVPFARMVQFAGTDKSLRLILFYYFILELLLLTGVIHFTGLSRWFGAVFFLYTVIYAAILLERNAALTISIAAGLFYSILVLSEAAGFVPGYPPFGIAHEMPKNLFSLLLVPIMDATFLIIGYTVYTFAQHLREVESSKKEWEATFDSIADPLFIYDTGNRILKCNKAYAEVAGMPFHAIIGAPFHQVFPKLALKLQKEEGEIFDPAADRIFDAKTYPIKDTWGEYLYSLRILKDITKIRKAEAEIHELLTEALLMLSTLIEAKSPWTRGHSERVASYAPRVGQEIGLAQDDLEQLRIAALLHDIGKIAIFDVILNKPKELTDTEYEVVKRHPARGADMLSVIRHLRHVTPWILGHHERYDGRGYPHGLKGEEIPLQARILAVADTFDAMTSARPYRNTLRKETALQEMKRFSGTQFDPMVVAALLRVIP